MYNFFNDFILHKDGENKGLTLDSSLMGATKVGCLETVKLLVENGANLEYQNQSSDNETVIIVAARQGRRNVLEYLIKQGCNINYQASNDETALMNAVRRGYIDNVKVLLNYKADVSLKDNEGRTAMDYAKENGIKPIIELLENVEK